MVPISRYWPVFNKVLFHQALMQRMIKASGVNAYMALRVDGGLAFLEAETKCRFWLHEEACRLWLEDEDGDVRRPPEFCPNAGFFLRCRTAKS
jgi:hypothetical protein